MSQHHVGWRCKGRHPAACGRQVLGGLAEVPPNSRQLEPQKDSGPSMATLLLIPRLSHPEAVASGVRCERKRLCLGKNYHDALRGAWPKRNIFRVFRYFWKIFNVRPVAFHHLHTFHMIMCVW